MASKEKTRRGMEVEGYIIQYVCDEEPRVNDLIWGYDDTVQAAREGKQARLPDTITAASADGSALFTKRAHRAFRGKWKDFEHMLQHGTEPYCNRLKEVALSDIPFTGLEPDEKEENHG